MKFLVRDKLGNKPDHMKTLSDRMEQGMDWHRVVIALDHWAGAHQNTANARAIAKDKEGAARYDMIAELTRTLAKCLRIGLDPLR